MSISVLRVLALVATALDAPLGCANGDSRAGNATTGKAAAAGDAGCAEAGADACAGRAPSSDAATPVTIDAGAIDDIIVKALRNEQTEGFNSALPSPGGLFINWVYAAAPPPTLVNLNTNGVPDPSPTTRHDRLTDLAYLTALALYRKTHSTDHQFDGEITKYTNIVASEFNGHVDERGWVYFAFKETGAILPAFAGYGDAMADAYDASYQGGATKFGQAVPIYYDVPADNPRGTYRCDLALEAATALIDSGHARGLTNYVADGEALLSFVQAQCYSSTYSIWAMQMGNLFTDTTLTKVTPVGGEVIRQAQGINGADMKTGAIAEMVEALCRAEIADPGRATALPRRQHSMVSCQAHPADLAFGTIRTEAITKGSS